MPNVFMEKGLTLPEVLLTLALLGVLATAALPRFDTLLQQTRSASIINLFTARIEAARKTALSRGETLTLCPGIEKCRSRDDWIAGARLFVDVNANGRIDPPDVLLRTFARLDSSGEIRWRSFGNRAWIQFRANGLTPSQSGRFTYCPEDADPRLARQIILNAAGRIRHAQDSDGDGIVESSDGAPITC